MKNQFRHIAFALLSAVLLVSASVLTFGGWSNDLDITEAEEVGSLSLDNEVELHELDTAQFFIDNSCYEYCKFEKSVDNNEASDQLSKTVVRVENNKGVYEDLETTSIKTLPPNTSLNLMIEKYTVKRHFNNSKPSFFVTVESFNTTIERTNLFDYKMELKSEGDAFLNSDQIKLIKQFCADEQIAKICQDTKRPL